MARYDDVLEFLATHENERETRMNRRTTLTAAEIGELRTAYPGIPDDYLDYLTEVGWGSFRECQYMVYGGPIDPDEIFGAQAVAVFGKRILCFGDNFSGDPGAFLPDEDWKVVEIWHDSLDIHQTNKNFGAFIREQMLMDENGNDLRASL
jgi:hypothetical protein